jgi:hypothetical protein
MLDHIKRKVVEAAKAPDRKRQQQADPPTRTLKNQQQRRHDPDSQEQQALALDPKWIREVFHACNAPSQRPAFRNSEFGSLSDFVIRSSDLVTFSHLTLLTHLTLEKRE